MTKQYTDHQTHSNLQYRLSHERHYYFKIYYTLFDDSAVYKVKFFPTILYLTMSLWFVRNNFIKNRFTTKFNERNGHASKKHALSRAMFVSSPDRLQCIRASNLSMDHGCLKPTEFRRYM